MAELRQGLNTLCAQGLHGVGPLSSSHQQLTREDFRGWCPSLLPLCCNLPDASLIRHCISPSDHLERLQQRYLERFPDCILLSSFTFFLKSPKIVWQSQVISGSWCEICVYNFFSRLFFVYWTLPYVLLHICSFTYCMYNLDSRSQFWSQPFISISM